MADEQTMSPDKMERALAFVVGQVKAVLADLPDGEWGVKHFDPKVDPEITYEAFMLKTTPGTEGKEDFCIAEGWIDDEATPEDQEEERKCVLSDFENIIRMRLLLQGLVKLYEARTK